MVSHGPCGLMVIQWALIDLWPCGQLIDFIMIAFALIHTKYVYMNITAPMFPIQSSAWSTILRFGSVWVSSRSSGAVYSTCMEGASSVRSLQCIPAFAPGVPGIESGSTERDRALNDDEWMCNWINNELTLKKKRTGSLIQRGSSPAISVTSDPDWI